MNWSIKHFSRSTSTQQVDPQWNGNDTAIWEACESDLVSFFWWKSGISFKKFCALCYFGYKLEHLRSCEQPKNLGLSGTAFDITMLLTVTDTLPTPTRDKEERLACTSSYNVSSFWKDPIYMYFRSTELSIVLLHVYLFSLYKYIV